MTKLSFLQKWISRESEKGWIVGVPRENTANHLHR
jgi:hypothetical protein